MSNLNPASSTPAATATSSATPENAGAAPKNPNQSSSPESAKPTQSEIRKMKLKLEGQEVELPEDEVIALAQQGKISSKRFQEASALRKQAEEVIKFAKENPTEFFKKTGMNAREWAENYLMDELKREQMSPEQRKAAENEEKLRQYEEEKKANAQAQEDAEHEELRQKHHANYEKIFIEALNKSGLPKTAFTVGRMAQLQLVNVKKGLDCDAETLAKIVREDYVAEQKALFGAMEGDALLEMFGPEVTKKLSKAQIAKLKAKGVPVKEGARAEKRETDPGQQMSWREYQLKNRRRAA